MKKIKNKKKFKIINTNKQILWAILSMFVVVGGAIGINSLNTVRAEGIPAHEKTIRDNHDGTYTLSLNVTGESEPSEEPTSKANVIIVLDKSGSMAEPVSTNGATYNNRGKFCRTGNDPNYTYYQTYYRTGNYGNYTYHLVGDNDNHNTVYYQTATVSSTSWNTCNNNSRYNFTNNDSRYDQTKTAVKNAVSTLLSQNSTKNTDVVEVALMTFSTTSQFVTPSSATATGWISGSNTTSIDNAVDSIQPVGGTNWDMALYNAISLASAKKTAQPNEEVYVIFFSDGEPTLHNGNASSATSHTHNSNTTPSGGGNHTDDADKNAAYYEGKRMYNNYNLYGILAYGSGDTYMKELVSYANYNDITHANPAANSGIEAVEGKTYFKASDQESINNAFNSIVTSIIKQIGFSEVAISDGTTAAKTAKSGNGAIGSLLKVDKSSYKYYLSFPLKANGTSDSQYITEITKITDNDTCKNCYALKSSNGNTYNVSRVTAYEIDPTTKAETNTPLPNVFKFEWQPGVDNPLHQENPPTATYNTETDAVEWDLSTLTEPVLLNDVTYTVSFDVYPGQVTLDIMADVKNGKRAIPENGIIEDYIICDKTTKDCRLQTNTDATLTYTDTRTEDDEQTIPFTNPEPVPSSTVRSFSVAKKWENFGATTGEAQISLNIDRDDSAKHYNVTLNNTNEWKEDIFASIGIMIVKDGHVTVKEGAAGHEYSFSEEQDISYKWELDSPVIRPMMVNGAPTTLIKVDKPTNMTGEVYEEAPTDDTPDTYYVNENGKNVYYKLGNDYYVVGKGEAVLTATNSRRSHLDLTKKVTGADAPADAFFTFDIKVDEGKEEAVYFSLQNENEEYMVNNEDMTYFSGEGVSREIKVLNPDEDSNITDITPNYENGEIVSITYKYKGTPYTVEYVDKTSDGKYYRYYTDYYYMASGKTVTIKMKADWNVRFTNLSSNTDYEITESNTVVDADNNTITGFRFVNTIDQDDSQDTNIKYEGTIDTPNKEFKVTYNNEYILTHVDVTKSWDDNENQDGIRPDNIEVVLTATDPTTNVTTTKKITLDGNVEYESDGVTVVKNGETASWKATFADLPIYASDGTTKIVYDVNETKTDVIKGEDGPGTYAYIVVGTPEDGYTITNQHTPEVRDITVTKVWSDGNNQDDIRPSNVTVGLYIGTELQGNTVTLSSANEWTYTWEDVDKYANGSEITYTVKETETSVITGTDGPGTYAYKVEGSAANGFTVTNTHTPEVRDITVTKVWSDSNNQDGKRPTSVNVGLYANGTIVGTEVTLNEGNKWTYTWEGVAKYAGTTDEITYTVKETETSVITGTDGPGTYSYKVEGSAASGFTVTNTHTPEKRNISVTKVWSDNDNQDGIRPSNVTVGLYIGTELQGNTVTLSSANEWTYTWENLTKYANGSEITYTVKETTTSVITGTDAAGTYAYKVEGSAASGFTVTNTHTPEVRDITVTKVWSDANNQDGKRPTSVNVGLYANGTIVGTEVTLNEGNKWTYTWEDITKYADGTEITYAVKETTTSVITGTDGPGTYKFEVTGSASTGFTVTNTHTPEVVTVSGTKTWEDNNNAENSRPSTITVNLLADNVKKASQSVSGPNWTYSWTGLPKYDGGKEIKYTVTEEAVSGYAASISGYNIKNTLDPTAITVTKKWVDANDQDGIRPDSIEVNLIAKYGETEKVLRHLSLSSKNSWTDSFTNLPQYMNGLPVEYSLTETTTSVITRTDGPGTYKHEITGSASAGFTVTNTHTPEVRDITVTKVWSDANNQDGKRPTSVNVGLYANGTIVGTEITLNEENKWTYTWEDLTKYTGGSEITYTVKEVETSVITGTDAAGTYAYKVEGSASAGFTVTNTHTPELRDITVSKTWTDGNNQDGIRPASVNVGLYANGTIVGTEVTLNEGNKWTYTWEDLTKYNGGSEITYTVKETETSVITGTDGPGTYAYKVEGSAASGFTVTNTHTPEVRDVVVTKVWDDAKNQDGIRPNSITVNLIADGVQRAEKIITEADGWTYTWKNLPKYAGTTDEIVYTLTESTTSVITGTDGPGTYAYKVTGDMNKGFTVTNTHTPEETSVSGTKTWDDAGNQDGKRPESITVNLLADGKVIDSKEVTSADKWAYSWTKLPKYAGTTDAIVYTITEDAVSGYTASIKGFNITNSYTPEKTAVSGKKIWNDKDDQDGKRPLSVTVNLLANGTKVDSATVTETNGWKYSFTDLPKFAGGSEIVYTVTEDAVPGYSTSIDGFTITNSYTPEKTSVSGTKTWSDNNNQDGKRPASITVNLLANGTKVGSKTVTSDDNWKYSFTGLDKYASGEEINYTVTEENVPGYSSNIDGFDITNTHTPEKTAVSGRKSWADGNNNDNLRPTEITINLLANDTKVASQTVTSASNWEYSFTGLDKYAGGSEINYTVTEEKVPGYTFSLDPDNKYIIVNTHNLNEVSFSVNKVWSDNDNQDGKRLAEVEVKLLGKVGDNVVVEDIQTLNETNKWTYTWTKLKEYDKGSVIVYSVVELTNIPGYSVGYSNSGNDWTITNSHTPEKVNISGTKVWDDTENNDGIRPDNVTFNLIKNDSKIDSVTIGEADEWKYSWTDLDKYTAGVENIYKVEEETVPEYTTEITKTTATDYVVTNTHTPETISFNITKTWLDADNMDGIRPEKIVVRLLANGSEVANTEITAENGWKYTFENLKKYADGVAIDYEIVEDPVKGYSTEITKKTDSDYEVTNTATTEITITKTWEDYNDISSIRPDSITVKLYADGKIIKEIIITKEDNWVKVISDLPRYKDGTEIAYTITEDPVPEYETTIDGFNITNSYEPGIGGDDPEILPPQTGVHQENMNSNIIFFIMTILNLKYIIFKRYN